MTFNHLFKVKFKFGMLVAVASLGFQKGQVKSSQVAFNEKKTMSIAQLYNVEKNIHETVKTYN